MVSFVFVWEGGVVCAPVAHPSPAYLIDLRLLSPLFTLNNNRRGENQARNSSEFGPSHRDRDIGSGENKKETEKDSPSSQRLTIITESSTTRQRRSTFCYFDLYCIFFVTPTLDKNIVQANSTKYLFVVLVGSKRSNDRHLIDRSIDSFFFRVPVYLIITASHPLLLVAGQHAFSFFDMLAPGLHQEVDVRHRGEPEERALRGARLPGDGQHRSHEVRMYVHALRNVFWFLLSSYHHSGVYSCCCCCCCLPVLCDKGIRPAGVHTTCRCYYPILASHGSIINLWLYLSKRTTTYITVSVSLTPQ